VEVPDSHESTVKRSGYDSLGNLNKIIGNTPTLNWLSKMFQEIYIYLPSPNPEQLYRLSALGQRGQNVRWLRTEVSRGNIHAIYPDAPGFTTDGTERQTDRQTSDRCFALSTMDAACLVVCGLDRLDFLVFRHDLYHNIRGNFILISFRKRTAMQLMCKLSSTRR